MVKQIARIDDAYANYVDGDRVEPHVRRVLDAAARALEPQPKIDVIVDPDDATPAWSALAMDALRDQCYSAASIVVSNAGVAALASTSRREGAGDFLVFASLRDLVTPDALFQLARAIAGDPALELIYSDEDTLDGERRHTPTFKPDWSPALLLARPYVGDLVCVRRSVFEAIGGLDPTAADPWWDLLLRVAERSPRVHHVPRVLYHRRARPARPIDLASLTRSLARRGVEGVPYADRRAELAHLDFADRGPRVAIVIPSIDPRTLAPCLASLERTTYRDRDIVVIDNGACDPQAARFFAELSACGIRVERIANDPSGFSFSAINNEAVRRLDTELVLFLNDDTVVREPRWLSRMVGYLQLPGVGATGACLRYADGSIQHAGIALAGNRLDLPVNALAGLAPAARSPGLVAEATRECAAVTAACLLTSRAIFRELGGFHADPFRVSLGDVDYCLRLAARGLRVLYVAGAELTHHEGTTRPKDDDLSELVGFRRRHGRPRDPFYNPNLEPDGSFRASDEPVCDHHVLLGRPLALDIVVPDLAADGARFACELACAAATTRGLAPRVIAGGEGALATRLEAAGVAWHLAGRDALEERLRDGDADVVLVGSIDGAPIVLPAAARGRPTLWAISEALERGASHAPQPVLDALRSAYGTLFPSDGVRFTYGHRQRARIVRSPAIALPACDRAAARQSFGIPFDALVIAYAPLCATPRDVVRVASERLSADRPVVVLAIPTARAELALAAADVFVYDRPAGAPLDGVRDAMAAGLPIVTVLCVGMTELVRFGHNAVAFRSGSAESLGDAFAALRDDGIRARLGAASRALVELMPSVELVGAQLERLVAAAWRAGVERRRGG